MDKPITDIAQVTPAWPTTPEIDSEVLQFWQLSPVSSINEGSHNQHWLVKTPQGSELVLRRYMANHFAGLDYEFAVMRRLHDVGWPVPVLEEAPIDHGGRTWCLLTKLPGVSNTVKDRDEQRRRGRLLAELHESTKELTDLGQRTGFLFPNAILSDPSLMAAIKKYEAIRPDIGYILRWYIERAVEQLMTLDLESADKLVLHSDLIASNILYDDDDELSGILDFEATHLNVRVADFALSWRGCYDEVIHGYEEVHKLNDIDWQLLVPTFWSWLFIGVGNLIELASQEELRQVDFTWQIKLLTRRSELFGDLIEPFPGQAQ